MSYMYNKAVKSSTSIASKLQIVAAAFMIMALALSLQGVSQAKGGGGAALPGDNKQVVTGTTPPCATTTIDSGATSRAIASTDPSTGQAITLFTPLTMKGTLANCSTSFQAYYIEFKEQLRDATDTLGQQTCALNFGYGDWSVGDYLMKSGDKKGWGFTIDIASAAGVADPTNCFGVHNVTATVIDRTTGVLLQTVTATYTLVQ